MKRFGRWTLRVLAVLLLLGWGVTCTRTLPLPEGVAKETHRVTLGEDRVKVDFYYREDLPAEAPLVVVAHGFSRGREHMAGWGVALAEEGMVAAVLDQPKWVGHRRNGRAIAALLDLKPWPVAAVVGPKRGLVGYSMGGLTTLLAAVDRPVDVWLGLDPVDFDGLGAAKVSAMSMPALALLAEPAPFNREGNAVLLLADYGGPLQMERVAGSSHIDPEWPPNLLGELACGPWTPELSEVFRQRGVAFLKSELLGAPAVMEIDPRLVPLPRGAK